MSRPIPEGYLVAVERCGFPRTVLIGRDRTTSSVLIRACVAYYLRRAGWTLQEIADAMGSRDHSTILYHIQKVNLAHSGLDPTLAAALKAYREALGPPGAAGLDPVFLPKRYCAHCGQKLDKEIPT